MEIKIGIENVGREIVVNADLDAQEAQRRVNEALTSGSALILEDNKGVTTVVPGTKIGYVEIGQETKRQVGFTPLPLG